MKSSTEEVACPKKIENDSVGCSKKYSYSLTPMKLENSKHWPNLVIISPFDSSLDFIERIEHIPESVSTRGENCDDNSDCLTSLLHVPTDELNKKMMKSYRN